MEDKPLLPDEDTPRRFKDQLETVQAFLATIQSMAAVLVSLSALALISGFTVTAFYTLNIPGYTSFPRDTHLYLTAGVGYLSIVGLPLMTLLFLAHVLLQRIPIIRSLYKATWPTFVMKHDGHRIWNLYILWLFLIWGGLGFLASCRAFANAMYSNVEREASYTLFLRSDLNPALLSLTGDSSKPGYTSPLIILQNTSEGMLVADPNTGRTVYVKHEAIIAIIDSKVHPEFISSTPTATFTPVPTETPTP